MRYLTIIIVILTTLGCVSTPGKGPARGNKLFQLEATGTLKDNSGILVLSAGRTRDACDSCNANAFGILPFVSYHVFKLGSDNLIEEVAFIKAEAGMSNQIEKSNYGFIHLRELPAGKYLIAGVHSRGYDMMFSASGMFMTMPDYNDKTGIAFEFEITSGTINYGGELLTVNGDLTNSSIDLSDHSERDLAFSYKKYPTLKSYDVNKIVLQSSNKRVN